jgi:hypothetical protein
VEVEAEAMSEGPEVEDDAGSVADSTGGCNGFVHVVT